MNRRPRQRSRAWALYATIAGLGVVGTFAQAAHPKQCFGSALATMLVALYARYLYRGGRWVIIPIPGCLFTLIAIVALAAWSLHL